MNGNVNTSGGTVGTILTGDNTSANVYLNTSGSPDKSKPVSEEYYRLDRHGQIGAIRSFRPWGKRPVICVLHGKWEESPEMFFSCLRNEDWWKRVDPECQTPPTLKMFHFKSDENPETIRADIIRDLANKVDLDHPWDTPEAINEKTRRKPVIVFTMVSTNRLRNSEKNRLIFEKFKCIWKDWPDRIQEDAPLIACLVVIYRPDDLNISLWDRLKMRLTGKSGVYSDNRNIEHHLKLLYGNRLLPILEPVGYDDVIEWAGKPDILPRIAGSITYETGQIFEEAEKIPLGRIAGILADRFPKIVENIHPR